MTVLSRYLFREFLRAAGVCILGFLLLFLLIDFVDHAEKLMRHNAGLREIGWYYLTRVPGMFVLISPVGTMLAVLVAVSLRVRSNELTAIFSGGVSLFRACVPILVGCALVSALSLLCSEVLAPAANRHAREIERLRVRPGKVAAQFSGNRYWMRGERGKLSRHAEVARAIDYLLKRWPAFTGFLEDGRICISNNAAERALRGIALGRKSWLFCGSDRAGERPR